MKIDSKPSFLPLVDIFFSIIGIFLIVLTFNTIIKKTINLNPTQTDVVILCERPFKYNIYSKNIPMGNSVAMNNIENELVNLRIKYVNKIRIIAAFRGNTFPEKKYLETVIRKQSITKREKQKLVGLDIMWWPLSSNENELPPMVKWWQKSNPNGIK